MIRQITIAIFAASLVLVGCSEKSEQKATESDRAESLLSQGQTSEAIYILTQELKEHPDQLRTRTLLASAYVQRSGITLASFQQFTKALLNWDEAPHFSDDGTNPDLKAISKAVWRIYLITRIFDSIPTLNSKQQIEDIVEARRILQEAPNITGGPAIYRGLIKFVIFKENFTRRYKLRTEGECENPSEKVHAWLKQVDRDLQSILLDVAAGFPKDKDKKKILALAKELSRQVGEASDVDVSKRSDELNVVLQMVFAKCAK